MKLREFEARFGISWDDIHKYCSEAVALNTKGEKIRFKPVDYQVFRYHVIGQHSLEATADEFGLDMSEILDLIADLVVRVKEKLSSSPKA